MIDRPTESWRTEAQEQTAALAAGTLTEAEAYAPRLWPEVFIAAVDSALDRYEADVQRLHSSPDEEVLASVQQVVFALNAIAYEHGRIETDEREELCEYIDDVLTDTGVDVAALTARHGIGRSNLTDKWREW